MPDMHNLIMFSAASVLLALAPGPDNIFVLTQSIVAGRRAGMIITLGLCTGLVLHTAIVALGLAAVFRTSVLAFNAVKYIGAAYLLYLSWRAFRAPADDIALERGGGLTGWQYYRRGILMNVTNPKVSLFFLAFLPQFADPHRGRLALQLVFLGAVFMAVTVVVFGAIGQLSGFLGERIAKSARGQIVLNRIAGAVFASLALKLIFTEQN